MHNKLLYVFDSYNHGAEWFRKQRFLKEADIFLCPVTVDQRIIDSVVSALKEAGYRDIDILNYIDEFSRISFRQRQQYIRFVAEVGNTAFNEKKKIAEYFKHPWKEFSFWWQSLISEKNPSKSSSFTDLITALTILEFQKERSCSVVVADIRRSAIARMLYDNAKRYNYDLYVALGHRWYPVVITAGGEVIQTLKYLIRTIYWGFRLRIVLGQSRNFLGKEKKECRYLLVTPFPLVDKESLSHNVYINRFYSLFQKELDREYKGSYGWCGLIMEMDGFRYVDTFGLIKQLRNWGHLFYVPEQYLGLKEYSQAIFTYIYVLCRYIAGLPVFIRIFRNYNNNDIWSIFEAEWMKSFCGIVLMHSILHYLAFRNIFKHLDKGTVVVYLAENQSWEKMLNIAAKEVRGIKTVGYQHSSIRFNLLNYFNDSLELEDKGYVRSLPVPDYMGCVGDIPVKILRECGWNKEGVFVWGAMRYQYLREEMKRDILWKERNNSILVALPIRREEAEEILLYIYQAFREREGLKVFIKAHYALPMNRLCKKIDLKLDSEIFEITDISLSELLAEVKAVIVNCSTTAIETLAFGCPVIIPRLANTLDLSPLTRYSSLGIYVSSPHQLHDKVIEILKMDEAPISQQEGKDFVLRYFRFLDGKETFLSRLESVIA